jgi:hypothetical protein
MATARRRSRLPGRARQELPEIFESFNDFKLGIDGRVAFIATLTVGVGGVDSSNNKGIWIGSSDEDLQLVVRTGDVIDGKVLTNLPQFGVSGNQFDMNENGVLWVGSFGLAKALVFSRILGDNADFGEDDDVDIPLQVKNGTGELLHAGRKELESERSL